MKPSRYFFYPRTDLTIRLELQDRDAAREAFKQSISADASYLVPYLHLASIELKEGRWKEAADLTQKLVQLDPYHSLSHYLHALANFYLGHLDLAAKSLRAVEKSGDIEKYPGVHFMLGQILTLEKDIPAAAKELRLFLDLTLDTGSEELRGNLEAQLDRWKEQGLIDNAALLGDPKASPD